MLNNIFKKIRKVMLALPANFLYEVKKKKISLYYPTCISVLICWAQIVPQKYLHMWFKLPGENLTWIFVRVKKLGCKVNDHNHQM